ncbi:MAG: hypothetical protein ACR2NP_13860 [Pirellulaceae bacterium]
MRQRRSLMWVGLLAGIMLFGNEAFAQPPVETDAPRLKDNLEFFAPYVGTWEIDGEWIAGGKIWARNQYSIGMNGNFFRALTWSRNEAGRVYQRYETIWRIDPESGAVQSYGFTYDGAVTVAESEIDESGEGRPVIRAQWEGDGANPHIKQEVQMADDEKSYHWRVWSSPDGEDWTQIMDGIWHKTSE